MKKKKILVTGGDGFIGSHLVDKLLEEDHEVTALAQYNSFGSFCHVAPGAVVCGDVLIGDNCFIGCGAIVPEGTKLADNTIVKAGQVVKNK